MTIPQHDEAARDLVRRALLSEEGRIEEYEILLPIFVQRGDQRVIDSLNHRLAKARERAAQLQEHLKAPIHFFGGAVE